MRVFIGMEEVAGVEKNYALGLRAQGHTVFTVANYISFYQDFRYDLVLKGDLAEFETLPSWKRALIGIRKHLRLFFLLFWALRRFDLFISLYGTSFLPGCLDYPLLKLFGKKIISVFLGSEIRYAPALKAEMEQLGLAEEIRPFIDNRMKAADSSFRHKLNLVQKAEKFADLILSQPGFGQLQSRPYMRINLPIVLEGIKENIPGREIPLVIHAPSKPGIKGTEYILAAVEELKQEGLQFEFRLITRMPNHELKLLLAEADIVVDDLFADTIGVLALESLAAGSLVLAHYPEAFARVPPGCPAVNVTLFNFKEKLRQAVQDRDFRITTAKAGRAYVDQYHDHRRIAAQILDWVQPGKITEYDFTPHFYQSFAASLRNKR